MAEHYVPTVRIRRPRVTTDDRGRTVWTDTVETAQLELVSTAELQKILSSTDDDTRSAIERIVTTEEEGVLARDPSTGLFEIISDADLKEILKANQDLPKTVRPADTLESASSKPAGALDELSLVSTQVLRKVLRKEGLRGTAKGTKNASPGLDEGDGFDPYNSG